jgi:hypothetical protein
MGAPSWPGCASASDARDATSLGLHLTAGLARAGRRALLAGVLTLVLPGLAGRGATLDAAALSDTQVKAAFLFNFTLFVHWPDSRDGPLVIGIAGDDALAETVARTVHGRMANARALQTRRISIGDDPTGCAMVFIGAMRPHDAAELIQRVRGPVLTVGETGQFLRDGGMVRFFVENDKLRFQINQKSAEAAGLKLSSHILTLAAR